VFEESPRALLSGLLAVGTLWLTGALLLAFSRGAIPRGMLVDLDMHGSASALAGFLLLRC